jgi:hypothetical protein
MSERVYRYCPAVEHPMAPDYCETNPHPECGTCEREEPSPAGVVEGDDEAWPDMEIATGATEHDWGRMPLRMRLGIAWRLLRGVPFTDPGRTVITHTGVTRARPGEER